jgi:peptide/nickel transport system substrate-binding protein
VIAPYGTEVDYAVMTEAGPLASPYARQALSYAFNYNAYLTAAFHGYARRAYGPLASVLLGYDPHMFHYQTDLARARALLQKAGVKPGTVLTYTYSPGPRAQTAGLILQAQLAQLGITVKLQQLDEAAFNGIFYGSEPPGKRPNLMFFGWWPDYNDPYDECVPLVASYSAGAAGANAGYYHNKEVDALLAQMKNTDRELLVGDAHKLQDITGRVDPPALWLDEPAQATILARSLKGYVFNPLELQTYYFYTMHR